MYMWWTSYPNYPVVIVTVVIFNIVFRQCCSINMFGNCLGQSTNMFVCDLVSPSLSYILEGGIAEL